MFLLGKFSAVNTRVHLATEESDTVFPESLRVFQGAYMSDLSGWKHDQANGAL